MIRRPPTSALLPYTTLSRSVNFSVILFRPHHGDVGDRAVRDPQLRTVQDVHVALAASPRFHTAGVGAVIGRYENRSEEHTSELQSRLHLVCRLLLEKKKKRT